MIQQIPRPVILCILDGWGYRKEKENNAIAMGNTPNWNRWVDTYPSTMMKTSGLDVGLPNGQMGNSEVGHTNLGAGRIVMQDLPRIDKAIASGALSRNPTLIDFIQQLKETNGRCHLMGLMSSGGVHSHINHFVTLAKILDDAGIPVCVDAYLDGRDTPPDSGKGFIADFEKRTQNLKNTKICVISGRFYAMDRDNRWERITLAYDALVEAKGPRFASANEAISASYQNEKTDEFILPTIIGDYQGMCDGDGVLMVNYRSDRAREILEMLLAPDFTKAIRSRVIHFKVATGMTEYSKEHTKWLTSLFPPEDLKNIFGQVIEDYGKKQLRIAETEKYAHVTFFFNGGEEKMFKGEERILVPSPKVTTYDLKPEMSACEVTDKLVDAILSKKFDAIIVNYANGDMVGHTGILNATIKAIESVDSCLGRLEKVLQEVGGTMFVTADHGNAELMQDPETKAPYTAHTIFPVKAVLVNPPQNIKGLKEGKLADIAPTLLDLMHLFKPIEMTGNSLLIKKEK